MEGCKTRAVRSYGEHHAIACTAAVVRRPIKRVTRDQQTEFGKIRISPISGARGSREIKDVGESGAVGAQREDRARALPAPTGRDSIEQAFR